MENKNYYDILGISKDSNDREIKRAYKRLAIKYHPDRNKGNKESEEKFKEIKKAYEILSDKNKRSMYDQYGNSAFNQDNSSFSSDFSFSTSSDFGDIFGDVFGDIFGTKKRTKNKKKGSDILYEMELTLEEIFLGISKEISINVIQKCSVCKGSGSRPGKKKRVCHTCKGNGNIHMRQGFFSIQQTCPTCNGSCFIISNPCYICNGNGTERSIKKLFVKIPAGVDNNDRIRLLGEGNYVDNESLPGDLYIKIKIKNHSIFKREKNNLYCEVPINFSLAALGGEIEVPTLNGKIKIKIPPETQTGRLFRIRNKGIKSVNNNYIGDLLCKVIVETPVNLNNYQKKLLYDLGFSLKGNNRGLINNPKSKSFFDRVKKFFNDITK